MDLYIKFCAQNGGDGNKKNYVFDVVKLLEVVDGSDVLFSLRPKEVLALDAYHYKESLHWGITELADAWQCCVFKVPWGIGRYDPTIAFDPAQFNNPQIRISWDLANVRAVGATAFLDQKPVIDVIATIAERYPARPSGWLMHKHIHEWETASSGTEPVTMPTDYTHRTVFLKVLEDIYCPWSVLTKAKYNVEADKYIPFNWFTDDWMLWLKEFYGMWHQPEEFLLNLTTTPYRHLFLPGNLSFAPIEKDANKGVFWCQGTGCKVDFSAGTAAAIHKLMCKVDGSLPFNTWAYPFGDPKEKDEWLGVGDIDNIKFEIEQAIAEELAQVFLTQYRTY